MNRSNIDPIDQAVIDKSSNDNKVKHVDKGLNSMQYA